MDEDNYSVMTLPDVLDLVLELNKQPRTRNSDKQMGVYLELKYAYRYRKYLGTDPVNLLFDILSDYDLETTAKAEQKLPVVI